MFVFTRNQAEVITVNLRQTKHVIAHNMFYYSSEAGAGRQLMIIRTFETEKSANPRYQNWAMEVPCTSTGNQVSQLSLMTR